MDDRRQGQRRREKGEITSSQTTAIQSLVFGDCLQYRNPKDKEPPAAQRCSHLFSGGGLRCQTVRGRSHIEIQIFCAIFEITDRGRSAF
jgi:hypothetical protein